MVPMKILVALDCYLPGVRAGGPIRSIANLVDRLGDEYGFCIVTSDRDLRDTLPYPGLRVDQWKKVGKAQVLYLQPWIVSGNTKCRLRPMRSLLR